MPAGTRTFRFGETLLTPAALPPPPTRHALLAFLIALAAIIHIGTVGWCDIQNGAEGSHASAAREMWRHKTWLTEEPPLSYWLTIAAYKSLGQSAVAARLPVALATVAMIALTFLIGERLGGYWRGFVAGLIQLCGLGAFVWPRMVTPEPLFAAALEATLFCAVCGYQNQKTRRFWFVLVWVGAAIACLTRGWIGLVFPALVFLLAAIFFREARLRFRALLHWSNILVFLAIVLPWLGWMQFRVARGWFWNSGEATPLLPFPAANLLWWFPTALLILPGVCLAWRKIFRPAAFEFADALPLFWIAIGFVFLAINRQREGFDFMAFSGGFALFAAMVWERTPPALRLIGFGLTTLAGVALIVAAALNFTAALPALPASWLGARSVIALAGGLIVLASATAAHFSFRDRETLAITILLLGMVPVGMSLAEGMARFGPYLSLANAARYLQPRLDETGEVLFEGSPRAGSSLLFYLNRPPLFLKTNARDDAVFEKMRATHPVYLIVPSSRISLWQERLTGEFHIYHQVSTCGAHVVLSNQP